MTVKLRPLLPHQREAIENYLALYPKWDGRNFRKGVQYRLMKYIYLVDSGVPRLDAAQQAGVKSQAALHRYNQRYIKGGFDAFQLPRWAFNPKPKLHTVVEDDTVLAVDKKSRLKYFVFNGEDFAETEDI